MVPVKKSSWDLTSILSAIGSFIAIIAAIISCILWFSSGYYDTATDIKVIKAKMIDLSESDNKNEERIKDIEKKADKIVEMLLDHAQKTTGDR